MTKTRRLYHFTTTLHLSSILDEGVLRTTESNVSLRRTHAGPDVVWLTSNPTCRPMKEWGRNGLADKGAVRFTVDVPASEVHRWHDWAKRRGMSEQTIAALAEVGGSRSWWVIERPIPGDEWAEVIFTATGEPAASLEAA